MPTARVCYAISSAADFICGGSGGTRWQALQQHHENLNYYRSVTGAHAIAYFYPRAQCDTIVSVLNKVKCTSASEIRVTMAFFTDAREENATRLVYLKSRGCDVQVVMRPRPLGFANSAFPTCGSQNLLDSSPYARAPSACALTPSPPSSTTSSPAPALCASADATAGEASPEHRSSLRKLTPGGVLRWR